MKEKIEGYIKDLLNNTHRVIIPEMGAFIARSSAKENETLEDKTIVFNDILKFNDSLLADYFAKKENFEIDQALKIISEYSATVLNQLKEKKIYKISGFGILSYDQRGNIVFEKDFSIKDTLVETSPGLSEEVSEKIVETSLEKTEENSPLAMEEKPEERPEEKSSEKFEEKAIEPPPVSVKEVQNEPQKTEDPATENIAEEESVPVTEIVVNETKEEIPVTVPEVAIIPDKKKELVNETKTIEEELPPPIVSDEIIKPEPKVEPETIEKPIKKEETAKKAVAQKTAPPMAEGKEEPKANEETPVAKKVIKEQKKTKSPSAKDSEKKSKIVPIIIWSSSGLLFLSMIFLASVKFGLIKGVKLNFSMKDEWVSINEKLAADLKEFNKKNRDQLKLPEGDQADDNFKGAFSSGSASSDGSFDAPSGDDNSFGSGENATQNTTQSSSDGSFDVQEEKSAPEKEKQTATENKTSTSFEENKEQTVKNEEKSSPPVSTGKYILVAGSFKEQSLAEKFAVQLQSKGFDNASYIGRVNGLHMVAYGTFDKSAEAHAEYSKLNDKGVQTYITKR